MSLFDSLLRLAGGIAGSSSRDHTRYGPASPPLLNDDTAISTYRAMQELFSQNGLYEHLALLLRENNVWRESLAGLRTPANRVAEFYAVTVWPGADLDEALPIETDNQAIIDPIKQVWGWSNWSSQKQVAARCLARDGDLFIKVVGRRETKQVYFQRLEATTTTNIDVDQRGYLTYIRLDIPVVRRVNDKQVARTVTEVWDHANNSFRVWEHEKDAAADISQLGTPKQKLEIRETFGFDFIPIVQTKFRDTGDLRGRSSYEHAFDKINEANRSATRLHQMLFRHNDATMVISGAGNDAQGRPLPGVRVGNQAGNPDSGDVITIGDTKLFRLPGTSKLEQLVPNIHYGEALAILNAMMMELEDDLPEMTYYRLRDLGASISGRAVQMMLSVAIARAKEARGNAEAGLIRADMMALTIGQQIGAFSPALAGTFEGGNFEHHFKARDVIPGSELEDAQTSLAVGQAAMIRKELGVPQDQILDELGYSEQQIAEFAAAREADGAALGTSLLDQFSRGNAGGNPITGNAPAPIGGNGANGTGA